jgi:hypothetical protein
VSDNSGVDSTFVFGFFFPAMTFSWAAPGCDVHRHPHFLGARRAKEIRESIQRAKITDSKTIRV